MSTLSQHNNNRRQGGNGEVQKRRSSRKPFQQLTNTPSKMKSSSTSKPSKPLYRSLSAPVVRSATPEVEEDKPIQDSAPARSQYVFRSAAISEELDDMWALKRANPVFDEDDDDKPMESPTKRTRTLEGRDEVDASDRQILPWSAQILEDENGFSIVL